MAHDIWLHEYSGSQIKPKERRYFKAKATVRRQGRDPKPCKVCFQIPAILTRECGCS